MLLLEYKPDIQSLLVELGLCKPVLDLEQVRHKEVQEIPYPEKGIVRFTEIADGIFFCERNLKTYTENKLLHMHGTDVHKKDIRCSSEFWTSKKNFHIAVHGLPINNKLLQDTDTEGDTLIW